jgi:hypothetical protein
MNFLKSYSCQFDFFIIPNYLSQFFKSLSKAIENREYLPTIWTDNLLASILQKHVYTFCFSKV